MMGAGCSAHATP